MIIFQAIVSLILFFYTLGSTQEVVIFYDKEFPLRDNQYFVGKDTTITSYFLSGKIKSIGAFALNRQNQISALKVGYWKEYYENGNLKEEGKYEVTSGIDCGTGGLERFYVHYKTENWKYFDERENLEATGQYVVDTHPIDTRCGEDEMLWFGLIDSTWTFQREVLDGSSSKQKINAIDLSRYETVRVGEDSYSLKYVYDRARKRLVTELVFQ